MRKSTPLILKMISAIIGLSFLTITNELTGQTPKSVKPAVHKFQIPPDYLKEPASIPSFWLSTYDQVNDFLLTKVHKGKVEAKGISAGGRPIRVWLPQVFTTLTEC
jgi:hypothetical protein